MNAIGLAFTAACCVLLLALPRRWALLPLLAASLLMTRGQMIDIGPAHFTVLRLVIGCGMLRLLVRGERPAHGVNDLDRLMLLWAACLLATSAFHSDDQWVYRGGLIWNDVGSYLLFRCLLRDTKDIERLFVGVCWLLVPLALAMLIEKRSGMNPLVLLGGVNEYATVRDGKIRAAGPFAHPILAGTVGAACVPMALWRWRAHRMASLVGLGSCLAIVYASTSSGPVLMLFAILGGLLLLRRRRAVPALRILAVLGVMALSAVMKDPFYFVLARIDIAGGSTGWHRAQLIRSWLDHSGEWLLAGTDYTRHWMPTGIYANSDHTDITNHFIQQAVWGGLPLLLVFMLLLWCAFARVGRELRAVDAAAAAEAEAGVTDVTDVTPLDEDEDEALPRRAPIGLTWTAGVLLFGHVVNFVGISLFDQTIVFFVLVLAMIGTLTPDAARDEAARADEFGSASRVPPAFDPHRPRGRAGT